MSDDGTAGRRLRGDPGTGLLGSAAGILVVLVFLLFAVQLLFGLYAATVVTSVTNDAARRAAAHAAPDREQITAEARRSLGAVGDQATFSWADEDSAGDGVLDTVVLTVVARPPRFVPPSVGGRIGLDRIERTVRVRGEAFR